MAEGVLPLSNQTFVRELAQFQSERNVAPPPSGIKLRPEVPTVELQAREAEPPSVSQQISSRAASVGGNVDVLA